MKDYVIFMDTAGDLSETYIQENDIRLVPMHYTLGKEDRICAKMEDEALLKRFYDGQRGGDLTQTSQITPQVYIDLSRESWRRPTRTRMSTRSTRLWRPAARAS